MAPELFVDTSAWYPLADPRHPDHHRLATALTEGVQSGVRVVTTNLILAETHALLLRRAGAAPALAFLREARRDPLLVEYITPDLAARAMAEWLERFDDQPFSLADGCSFLVMSDRGIEEALTLDRHFSIAGFRMVPAGLG
jgi:predicted nucleic acid-binding protein